MRLQAFDSAAPIFALSSGSLPSAVAIVKLSGTGSLEIARQVFKWKTEASLPRARGLYFGELVDGRGVPYDSALCLVFIGPHSHTGEDVVEFHTHGSVAVVHQLLDRLASFGARPAEKGEFSYRAIANGRMTQGELEKLHQLFQTQSPEDLSRSPSQTEHLIQQEVEALRQEVLEGMALCETAVDFSEEHHLALSALEAPLASLSKKIENLIQRYQLFSSGRTLPELVLCGQPNAGKSTLFNALLGQKRAIVHSEPGTTRDPISESLKIAGRYWRVIDTAGIRQQVEGPELYGIEMAKAALARAAFYLLVVDGTKGLGLEDRSILENYSSPPHLVVFNKSDESGFQSGGYSLSLKTGEGFPELLKTLETELSKIPQRLEATPTVKHLVGLEKAHSTVVKIRAEYALLPPEVVAEAMRRLLGEVESVVGEIPSEEILERIFQNFCIGK